jgi:hypothetical protein
VIIVIAGLIFTILLYFFVIVYNDRNSKGKTQVAPFLQDNFPLPSAPPAPPIVSDAFLSHDWGVGNANHILVSRINDELKRRNLVTWFDQDRMEGNILTKMTEGIDHSRCFVAFITKKYIEKVSSADERDNCKIEFQYAFNRFGPQRMIAVVVDSGARNSKEWTGLVGAALGSHLYVSLYEDSSPEKFSLKCDELNNRILSLIAPSVTSVENWCD